MKRLALFILLGFACSVGFSQNLRWNGFGTPIPVCSNLDVHWDAPSMKLPPQIWVYHILPNSFSPDVISNVMELCSFTEKDKIKQTGDGMTFQNHDDSRILQISAPSANIHYEIKEHNYGPTNLAVGVPKMSQLPGLTTNLLEKFQIPISAVTGYFQTDKFNMWEPLTEYFVHGTIITNIEFRGVNCRRTVDGMPVVGGDGVGLRFGEHGEINKISVHWHNLERHKSYPAVSQKNVVDFLRQGKAVQGLVPVNFGYIDWSTVKSVRIEKVWPSYRPENTGWLYPYLALWTTVETPRGNVDVEIDCPIIDEANQR